jgi:hypothetical protein
VEKRQLHYMRRLEMSVRPSVARAQ